MEAFGYKKCRYHQQLARIQRYHLRAGYVVLVVTHNSQVMPAVVTDSNGEPPAAFSPIDVAQLLSITAGILVGAFVPFGLTGRDQRPPGFTDKRGKKPGAVVSALGVQFRRPVAISSSLHARLFEHDVGILSPCCLREQRLMRAEGGGGFILYRSDAS
jgi:hypothetical protein